MRMGKEGCCYGKNAAGRVTGPGSVSSLVFQISHTNEENSSAHTTMASNAALRSGRASGAVLSPAAW